MKKTKARRIDGPEKPNKDQGAENEPLRTGHPETAAPTPNPNTAQKKAANPEDSVWVSAAAGSGKTKVLTDRVLRLLLPRADGTPATPPGRILCLTFTKAGANEMALRLNATLARWAVMPLTPAAPGEASLQGEIEQLLGRAATDTDLTQARKLFAEIIDQPGGLPIMTIHSFCQSVLARFPLEAGLAPHFKALDDSEAATLLDAARQSVFARATPDAETPDTQRLQHALHILAGQINEDQLRELIEAICAERNQFSRLLERHFGPEGLYTALCETIGIIPGEDAHAFRLREYSDHAIPKDVLQQAVRVLNEGNKTETKKAGDLGRWLALPPQQRIENLHLYTSFFLTGEEEPRAALMSKDNCRDFPELAESLHTEQARVYRLERLYNAIVCSHTLRALLLCAQEILKAYENLKRRQSALDFTDMILYTLRLLQGTGQARSSCAWVLYKLDHGLDHILVDEAQDTNPEQWEIIEALCHEFFSGETSRESLRTLFVVGDEKQSIFSFQRAAPQEFQRMRKALRDRVQAAQRSWSDIDLSISFRSARSVLEAVDSVFSQPDMRAGLGLNAVRHQSYRTGQAGLVEMWPLCEHEDAEEIDPWLPPVTVSDTGQSQSKLANAIAAQIARWIANQEPLSSRGRPIRPGDIMILMRTRTALVQHIIRALKAHNIPVAGADRLKLGEQIAVQDIMAALSFFLLPTDDLSLACFLKSPFIGQAETELFELSHGRNPGESLWSRLQSSANFKDTARYLQRFMDRASYESPYELIAGLLQEPCPADTRSGLRSVRARLGFEADDALDELLRLALDFQHEPQPSLQNFVHCQERTLREIKREQEGAGDQVRIMTVHAAKGLQAPIVFLPDTIAATGRPSKAARNFLWPDKTGLEVPVWCPRANLSFDLYETADAILRQREEEEARRLLYVAMTRAEDRLIICGALNKRAPNQSQSWYFQIKSGLIAHPGCISLPDGMLRLENPQESKPDRASKNTDQMVFLDKHDIPSFLFEAAPQDSVTQNLLSPSKLLKDQTVYSPLQALNSARFLRGIVTHKLLQTLPDLMVSADEKALAPFIERILKPYRGDVTDDVLNAATEEVLKILRDPDFAPLFGPGSRAEVPISGLTPAGDIISGAIDRLLINKDGILILDYKTNRPPPRDPSLIPVAYLKQMQAYADVLRQIYPGRSIKAALLWTDGPFLMPVPLQSG